MSAASDARDHAAALEVAEAALARDPASLPALLEAAASCVHLGRHADAVTHARKILALDADSLVAHDALAHALDALGRRAEAAPHGRAALDLRARSVEGLAPAPHAALAAPPAFDPARPERNAVAFSLYGASSRYCEPAILNAFTVPRVYPGWHARFYVDDSVPAQVIERLRKAGAQSIAVPPEHRALPGTMWRFLALDDATLDRVLLRDADSLVGEREARAVAEWLASSRWFHALRDHGSHTELLLAGLWGAARAALPPLAAQMHAFIASPHVRAFADQHFLRRHAWPRVRSSLLQHDSVFGWRDARPFPGEAPAPGAHVGAYESHWTIEHAVAAPEGTVAWWIYSKAGREFARYASPVRDGRSIAYVPTKLRDAIASGKVALRIELEAPQAGASPEAPSR